MMLLPSLQLIDPNNGRCVQVFDNCQTMAAVRRAPGWQSTSEASCDDCCPSCDDDPNYTGLPLADGAWWADPLAPGSDQGLGILVRTIELEEATSSRRLGTTSDEAPGYLPRLLTVRGRMLANSRAGVYHIQTSLSSLLTNPCGACDGWEAIIRPFCPEGDGEDADLVPIEQWFPADPEPIDWAQPCWNASCPEAEPLAPVDTVPTRTDSGLRTLLNIRFQYLEQDEEVEVPVNGCFGLDFVLGFEVWEDNEYGEPIEGLCTERPLVEPELTDCKPHDFTKCLWLPELDTCSTTSERSSASSDVEPVRSGVARNLKYCQPLFRTVRSCLVPILPVGSMVVPSFTINTGISPLSNLRLDIHPAYTGVPAPETCEGEAFYRNHATCGTVMLAGPIPANSRLLIDGRRRQVLLFCSGGEAERAENLVEGWDFQSLDPSCRYWLTSTADCINTGSDSSLQLSYSPRFQT